MQYTEVETLFTFFKRERSLIELVNQYFKDRDELFNDYYPWTMNNNCDLEHVYNWLKLYIYWYNTTIRNKMPFVERGKLVLN
jgi:hypothetical protein